uniref:Protein TIFY n=2 Tax=Cannabis sativa TaxID=3483 RepID=A0A803NV12_CANSA
MVMENRSDSDEVRLEEEPKISHVELKKGEEEKELDRNDDSKSIFQPLSESRSETMPKSASNTAPAAQLTIFYGGCVKIFDGIPEEKVNEIIRMAAATAAAIKSSNMNNMEADNASSSPVPPRSPAIQNAAAVGSLLAQLCPAQKSSLNKLQAEFPIARRHSLQSFLEKRRNRLVSKSPYPSSPMMKVENDSVV